MATSKNNKTDPVDDQDAIAVDPQMSYEQARDELTQVVARLESGGESLADSMELYTRGEYLVALCERYLTQARSIVEQAQS